MSCESVRETLTRYVNGDIDMTSAEPEAYLFPRMIGIMGPQHINFNALQRACEANVAWPAYEKNLRSVVAFLGYQGSRKRFLETCVDDPEDAAKFGCWSHRVVSWKW